MNLKLLKDDNPILRQKSEKVDKVNYPLERLAINLMVLMKSKKAVGLAAPQVGRSVQLIVFDCTHITRNVNDQGFMFNPEIVSTEGSAVGPEGCLSLPKRECQVRRAFKVTVKYLGLDNQYHTNVYSGLAARIVQHEVDHLYGTLMTDIEEKE